MSDKPLRRQITLVLDLDDQGNPVEINRGFYSDEYLGRSGALELLPAANIDEASLAGLLPDLATVIAQLTATQDALAAAKIERDEAVKAKADAEEMCASMIKAAEDKAAEAIADAGAKIGAAEADRDARVAEAVASGEQAAAALQAQIEGLNTELTSLKAQLEAAASSTSIHKAWLRAALADFGVIDLVDEAVKAAGPVSWELWAHATTISIDDPDVKAIAAALGIDLASLFELARSIAAARLG